MREARVDRVEAIGLAKMMPEPFGINELKDGADLSYHRARDLIKMWWEKGWLVRVSWGQYRRSESFGIQDRHEKDASAWAGPDLSVVVPRKEPKPEPKKQEPELTEYEKLKLSLGLDVRKEEVDWR